MNTLIVLFAAATNTFDLPPGLIDSLCYVESKYDINAVHADDGNGNSLGLCQVKLATAQWLGFQGTEKQLMDPEVNVYYAAKYLKRNIDRYDGNIAKGIIAYNRGNARDLTITAYCTKVLKQWTGDVNENN